MTATDDILRIFRKFNGQIEFTDGPTGFYGALREFFQKLAREEAFVCEWGDAKPIRYPSFGQASDNYEATVRPFYTVWANFATRKPFSWKDAYRYSEAPDRRVRRLMEKENKRMREEEIREFNDAVRSLVAFVKKRDPRVKPNKESEADRQKALKDASAAQAARSRATNQARTAQPATVPEWMLSSEPLGSEASEEDDSASSREEFQCVLCKKNFKSEKQYEAHERSRKHVKVVQQIRKDMRREDASFAMGTSLGASSTTTQSTNDQTTDEPSSQEYVLNEELLPNSPTQMLSGGASLNEGTEADPKSQNSPLNSDDPSAGLDDEHASREHLESCIMGRIADDSALHPDHSPSSLDCLDSKLATQKLAEEKSPRLGKAKKKRAKKAAAAKVGTRPDFRCATCQVEFPSKSALFIHIRDSNHARPVAEIPTRRSRKNEPTKDIYLHAIQAK